MTDQERDELLIEMRSEQRALRNDVEQIKHVKPAAVKGHYIKSVTLSATMSPGVPLQV